MCTHRFVGLWYGSEPHIESVVGKNTGENGLGDDVTCTVCEMAVVWVGNQLRQNRTRDQIENYLNSVSLVGMTGRRLLEPVPIASFNVFQCISRIIALSVWYVEITNRSHYFVVKVKSRPEEMFLVGSCVNVCPALMESLLWTAMLSHQCPMCRSPLRAKRSS